MALAAVGDLVLLVPGDPGRTGRSRRSRRPDRFLFRLTAEGRFQTDLGVIPHSSIAGLPYGGEVRSHLGYPYQLLRPTTADLVQDLKRSGQIMFPKDIGYILMKLGVYPGCRVLECGTGSGAMTLSLARAVSPSGHVYSYDVRADMQAVARKNIESVGLGAMVTFKQRDASEGFDESDLDAIFLDMPESWLFLSQAHAALAGGAPLAGLLPTMNQMVELSGALYRLPFVMIDFEELLLRPYKTAPGRVRPADRMIAHTGYLYFARKVLRLPQVSEPAGPSAPGAGSGEGGLSDESGDLPEGAEE